jgi:hypothetical protein
VEVLALATPLGKKVSEREWLAAISKRRRFCSVWNGLAAAQAVSKPHSISPMYRTCFPP